MNGTITAAAPGQTRVGRTLEAAVREGPSHAYLFVGPKGSGKAALARAFAAELLVEGSPDPEEARRRVLASSSPHPDLIWISPTGMSHAVAEVRERLIRLAPLSPFESPRRVFVVDRAEALNEESQNAMLKTLEEPPAHAHLILLSSDPEALLPTVVSRCQTIEFEPLPEELIESGLGPEIPKETATAVARLSRGDPTRAAFLVSRRGVGLRTAAERLMAAVLDSDLADSPWLGLTSLAEETGEAAGEKAAEEFTRSEEEEGARHTKSEVEEGVKRAARRARTGVLDLGLLLAVCWARDWASTAVGAEGLAFNLDRIDQLEEQAARVGPARAAEAVELIEQTRRSLRVNVSEELALEALSFRLERLLSAA